MIYLISLFIGAAIFCAFNFLTLLLSQARTEGKVYSALLKNAQSSSKGSFILPAIIKRADDFGRLLTKIKHERFKKFVSNIDELLKAAGAKYASFNAHQIIALEVFAAFSGALFCMFFISTSPMMIMIAAGLSFVLPYIRLKEAAKKRCGEILKSLPDAADLLSVMLDAGLDFFGALDKVSEILKGALSDEMRSASAKINLGLDRKTALLELGQNCRIEQAMFFVKTINMALESGSGMADTLKRLAARMRKEREATAQKKAQEAPVKILIPLILFIFPTIFIVIFGPIAINLVHSGGF
jgi:tight adherence protein C